jgi:hypothetical protein
MVTSPDHQRNDDGRGTSHTASESRTSYSTVLDRDAPEGVHVSGPHTGSAPGAGQHADRTVGYGRFDLLRQLFRGPAPSSDPFIVDAKQAAKRQVHHAH